MIDYTGTFIMMDGIAGSGKSTLLQHAKEKFINAGKKVFDMNDWNTKHASPPTFEDVSTYDVYFLAEPTKTWIGSAIREEISFHSEIYSGRVQAEAFALDRMIQYRRIVIPALQNGKTVIQDRGVTTSLVYQSTIDSSLSMEDISQIPGNAFTLEYPPQHLILTKVDPAITQERRGARNEMSKGMYEELDLLTRAQETFHGSDFCDLMDALGTTIHTVDTSQDLDSTVKSFDSILHSIISI